MTDPTGPRRQQVRQRGAAMRQQSTAAVRHHSGAVRAAMRASDSYALLLALLCIDYLLISLVSSRRWAVLVVGVPLSLTLILAMRTSHAGRGIQRLGLMSLPVVVLLGFSQAITDNDRQRGALIIFLAVPFIISPIVVVRRIMRHKRVGRETILGAICVYIMLAMAYGMVYIGMGHAETSPPFFAQVGRHPPNDYVYFSFITITTVGYGDLSPASSQARTVVVTEAVLGQIFLVTLVSRLVSLYGREVEIPGADIDPDHPADDDAGDADDPPGADPPGADPTGP